MSISTIINIVDEEVEFLPRALKSVAFSDEIVIVDMTEEEDISKIARDHDAKLFSHKKVPYVELVRNFGIEKAESEWILILDPDEEIAKPLRKKLRKLSDSPATTYYRLPRKNIIFGKWLKHSRWWPDHNIRFFKKGSVSWDEIIHAVPITHGQGRDVEAKEDNAIVHYHYTSVEQFISRMNRYTSVQAEILLKEGYRFDWKDLIKKPVNEFLSRYFFGEGFKDGVHGLAVAGLQALSELVLYLKIWQDDKFDKQELELKEVVSVMKESGSDINYWQADALIKQGAGLKQKIKRRLKI